MSKLDKQFIALDKQLQRMEKMGQRAMANNYNKLLGDLRKKMAKMYESYETDGQLTFDEMTRYNRLDKLDKDIEKMIKLTYRANGKVIRGTLTGVVADAHKGSIGIVNGYANQKVKSIMKPFDITKTVNREMAGLKWTHRIGKNRMDLIYDIQKEIAQGLTQGDTYGDMAKRLATTISNDQKKADLIIRTEAHRCKGESRQQSLNDIAKSGIKFKKKWVSGKDNRVRDAHDTLNGTMLDEDEDFVSPNGGVGYGPGQMNNASDDCNCRCLITMVIDTEYNKDSLDDSKESGYNGSKEFLQEQFSYATGSEKEFIPTNTVFENTKVIAGGESGTTLRVADKLAKQLGGRVDDWTKKAGKIESDKHIFDMHWYEREENQHKMKLKYRGDKK